jgi:maltose alpha-D-glucosyltransferase/alpha-amylase
MNNFFYCQPALNYGYAVVEEPWQMSVDSPAAQDTRAELLNIMDFWSELGADGFRVDMAESLVKNDPDGTGIRRFWQGVRAEFLAKHPDSALVAEWAYPKKAVAAGFHLDHFLHSYIPAYTTLFRYEKGCNQHNNWIGHSYFRREGKGDLREFLDTYLDHYASVKGKGYACIPSGDHDIPRLSMGRTVEELFVTHTFLLTMPGVPLVYYGDEIGMRYIEGLPSKEGGFNRTGTRTPMQWGDGKNLGFSDSDEPYLPVDSAPDAPTVAAQWADPSSLLHHTRRLIRLRRENPALWADTDFEVLYDDYPFVYRRSCADQTIVVAINPSDRSYQVTVPGGKQVLYAQNASLDGECLKMKGVSFIVYEN